MPGSGAPAIAVVARVAPRPPATSSAMPPTIQGVRAPPASER